MKKGNKKGSYFILVTIIFSGILVLIFAIIWAAGQSAISSTSKSLGRVWGRSILAEYDVKLQERYGLFAFYGDEYSVKEKIDYYAQYSFLQKEYIDYDMEKVSLDDFSICNKDNFQQQIKEIVLYLVKPVPIVFSNAKEKSEGVNSAINSQRIIQSLPSKGRGGGINLASLLEKITEGFNLSNLISEASENVYIFNYYKDYINKRDLGDTYFQNEIEYIISGKLNDEKARKSVKSNIVLLRNGLNLAYLYSSPEKRKITLAAAELITPGALAPVTQAIIMEVWAAFEASNDMKLLYDKKKVPIMKTDSTWAISLENVLRDKFGISIDDPVEKDLADKALTLGEENMGKMLGNDSENDEDRDYILPDKTEGLEYEDYLRILVSVIPHETRILRMQDLIQINMKYLYCDYFLLQDYYTGMNFVFSVNGRKYEITESY